MYELRYDAKTSEVVSRPYDRLDLSQIGPWCKFALPARSPVDSFVLNHI